MPEATPDDHALCRRAAAAAGSLLLELRTRPGLHPETMRADGDWQSHKLLMELCEPGPPDA